MRSARESRTLYLSFFCGLALSFPESLNAAQIFVPNNSFENPVTTFVNPTIDKWQKTAKPPWYDESGGYLWTQLTGVFKNTSITSANHIDNCDSNQAAWMFVVPQVGLFQDYNSPPTHDFNAIYEVGKSYHLTVGIIGGGGGMFDGVTIQLNLYYRDGASNMVTLGFVDVTNNSDNFQSTTHLVDFTADVPVVKAADPWAGQNIGIQILSTIVDTNMEQGYWDLDNVRLISIREPVLVNPTITNEQFEFSVQAEPGYNLQILAATNLASSWTSLGTLTNESGTVSFSEPATNATRRYYRARRLP